MEVWGGIECTINRLADSYSDQLAWNGHYSRQGDLESIAELGIKRVRYPVLWEKHKPQRSTQINWDHSEHALNFFREKGIEVIAGLVHHGSGPKYARFTDDSFAEGLAEYAAETARKFPWIKYYTPINEPVTTARFCGLYGLWHPHKTDDNSFLTILLSECKATVLAMKAIREINPEARLVMTEDLGKTHATPLLSYQAELENERRWLGTDILCGRLNAGHPLWKYVIDSGISEDSLGFFHENFCAPDLLGFNYYITSERFIDENLDHYPAGTHGGNGFHNYADIEAVRTSKTKISGPGLLLREAWERYHIPMAITEAHLHCTREEQLRWLNFIWSEAAGLERDGLDIRGVTVWALLGAFGWDKLLTEPPGTYEAGAFDVRSGALRPTAIKDWIRARTGEADFDHPVLCGGGWWERDIRVLYGLESLEHRKAERQDCAPLLILGKTGTLGKAFARICEHRDLHFELLGRDELNILDAGNIEKVIVDRKPWAIINAAGFVRVDDAEDEPEACFAANSEGPALLAEACARHGIRLLTFSSDLVFDGLSRSPYTEYDDVKPLNCYGRSKAECERKVLEADPAALLVRTSTFFGPWDKYNYLHAVGQQLRAGRTFKASAELRVSPTYVPDLVNVSLDLLIDGERGIWHLANEGDISFYELARLAAEQWDLDPNLVVKVPVSKLGLKAARPSYSVLASSRGKLLPGLHDALGRYFEAVNCVPAQVPL